MNKKIVCLILVTICMVFYITGCKKNHTTQMPESKEREHLESVTITSATLESEQQFSEDEDTADVSERTGSEESAVMDYANGECGTDLHWALSVEGVLKISGNGDMYQFSYTDSVPWGEFRDMITEVVIKDGVTSIGRFAFERCENLQKVSLAESVTRIELRAFQSCTALERITLPNGIEELPTQAFGNCTGLKEIKLPDDLRSIRDYAFSECTNLEEITIPAKVSLIGNKSFQQCENLRKIEFTNSDVSIGNAAFAHCSSLVSITIPAGVRGVESAFFQCTGLQEVFFEGDAPHISPDAFYNVTAKCYYPLGNTTWTISKMSDYGGSLTWEGR